MQTTVWKGRLTQAASQFGEVAPTTTVCCNACRTCVQTNVLTAVLAAAAVVVRRFRRS